MAYCRTLSLLYVRILSPSLVSTYFMCDSLSLGLFFFIKLTVTFVRVDPSSLRSVTRILGDSRLCYLLFSNLSTFAIVGGGRAPPKPPLPWPGGFTPLDPQRGALSPEPPTRGLCPLDPHRGGSAPRTPRKILDQRFCLDRVPFVVVRVRYLFLYIVRRKDGCKREVVSTMRETTKQMRSSLLMRELGRATKRTI